MSKPRSRFLQCLLAGLEDDISPKAVSEMLSDTTRILKSRWDVFTRRVISGRITVLARAKGVIIIEASILARRAVELAEDKQAHDIVMLDLRSLNSIADYFVVCSGESDRQLRAILNAVEEGIEEEFGWAGRSEGTPDSGWVLLDYGDVVIHVFSTAMREYYRLERLWNKATPVVVVQ